MSLEFADHRSISGLLLVAGPLLYIGSLIVLFLKSDFEAIVSGSIERSLMSISQHLDTFRAVFGVAAFGIIVTLLGFGLLSALLQQANGLISFLAFLLFLLAGILWVLEHVLHMSVTVWAAEKTSRTSTVPESYEPMSSLANLLEQMYTGLAFISLALYGWVLLQSTFLPAWVGWTSIIWSAFWLAVFLRDRNSIPALLLVMPLLIGIVLLLAG